MIRHTILAVLVLIALTSRHGNADVVTPPVTSYQGTLSVSAAATAVPISTLTLSSGAFPPTGVGMGVVFILNTGTGTAYICWANPTCTASGGSFPLVGGASVTKNIGPATSVPYVFSTAGTTLAITN